MSTTELKKRLIRSISQTDDNALLEEAYRLISLGKEAEIIFKLSEDQKSAIKKGQEDIRHGKFLTSAQAEREISRWLKK